MSPADDTPPLARLARWSEWWFTPRWRALLTWVALTGITLMVRLKNVILLEDMIQQPIAYLNRFLQAPLPSVFNSIASDLTGLLSYIWFQPLALRLSLRRGLAWIGLQLVAAILWQILNLSREWGWVWYAIECGAAALQCWVLWGWRSRPWMCLPAWVLTFVVSRYDFVFPALAFVFPALRNDYWLNAVLLNVTVAEIPKAALLLYGTRLLRPEERARGTPAQ